jgi:hypothetical protein
VQTAVFSGDEYQRFSNLVWANIFRAVVKKLDEQDARRVTRKYPYRFNIFRKLTGNIPIQINQPCDTGIRWVRVSNKKTPLFVLIIINIVTCLMTVDGVLDCQLDLLLTYAQVQLSHSGLPQSYNSQLSISQQLCNHCNHSSCIPWHHWTGNCRTPLPNSNSNSRRVSSSGILRRIVR